MGKTKSFNIAYLIVKYRTEGIVMTVIWQVIYIYFNAICVLKLKIWKTCDNYKTGSPDKLCRIGAMLITGIAAYNSVDIYVWLVSDLYRDDFY